MVKHKNLQPWLDYFEMLRTYEDKGLLEMKPEKHEAFITLPALLTLAECDRLTEQGASPAKLVQSVGAVVRRLRAFAAFCSQQGDGYLTYSFAVNVVTDTEPHDLLHTILVSIKRRWQNMWIQTDSFEVINYDTGQRI